MATRRDGEHTLEEFLEKRCAQCGKKKTDGCRLMKCSSCRQVYYCSEECQKKNWRRHKRRCGMFNEPAVLCNAAVTGCSCVDCGRRTGNYCDFCLAKDRIPDAAWGEQQRTPLCTDCDRQHDQCHFCRNQVWCVPPTWGN